MFVTLREILKNELFKNVRILAGSEGLSRKVRRVSVFDCPCSKDLLQRGILREGDVFITCLEQFRRDRQGIGEYIENLILSGSAGLLIVSEDMLQAVDSRVLEQCGQADFPLAVIPEEIPYAAIIDTVNKYIDIDNYNSLNMLKLEKILYGSVQPAEQMEILYSINPEICPWLQAVCVKGEFRSDIAQMELHTEFLKRREDIYVCGDRQRLFILSGENEKILKTRCKAMAARFPELFVKPVCGYSRIYNRRDIAKALEEAKRALETAKIMNMTSRTYDPLSSLQLLLTVRDSQEAQDFYHAYVEAISEKVSAENRREFLLTMEAFVANSGSYGETARAMNQHENTIRYRLNRVKSALKMEEDNVRFYETLAIAVKLRTLINEDL